MKENPATQPIDPRVVIGHVHLKVADLERALKFYCGVLGFELQQRFGSQAAFISAGGYHHHIGLNPCWFLHSSSEDGMCEKVMSISPLPITIFSMMASTIFRLSSNGNFGHRS